jgi:hypothetical protein
MEMDMPERVIVRHNPQTGGATITIPKGYLGDCICGKGPAKHTVWLKFDTPIPHNPVFGFPEYTGVWHNVCDTCLKPDDKIKGA